MATNMYRVGDYVYVETTPNSPYLIRRIEELNKNQTGNVEAKVMCFYRRRDLPNPLVQLADKHQLATAEDSPLATKLKKTWLRTPVGEEQAAQAVLDPSIAALDEERTSPTQASGGGSGSGSTSANSNNAGSTTSNTNTNSNNNNNNNNSSSSGSGGSGGDAEKGEALTSKQRYQIKHRELFLSRQVESIPATQIRGKCSVTLLNETESLQSYLNKDDTFFYCLVFDPNQKTLLADKGEIRVGSRYQCDIPAKLKDTVTDERKLEELESLVWTPEHTLTDRKIDQFLVVSRSIGTFARALDCSSSVKQPSLHMSAAAASRDITLFHAMNILHKHDYSIEEAMSSLVPSTGPVLCRDEIEDWSASEANLFEEALDKYGKDFNDIRQDFLPWKTLKQIIEYYYMWKTTDRYVQQKRVKAVEAELKLKQVYIPQYNNNGGKGGGNGASVKAGGGGIYNGTTNGGTDLSSNGKPCESCGTTKSSQWNSFSTGHITSRLCQSCWEYWRRYGSMKSANKGDASGDSDAKKKASAATTPTATAAASATTPTAVVDLNDDEKISDLTNRQLHRCSIVNCGKEFKLKTHLARHYAQAHGIAISSGSPRPIMKTRTAFYLHTNPMTRVARVICRSIVKPKKAARQSAYAINGLLVKQEFTNRISGKSQAEIKKLLLLKPKDRGSVTKIANRLGAPGSGPHEWLVLTPKDKMPLPAVVSFPKPPKAADGSLVYDRVPNKSPDIVAVPAEKELTIIPTQATSTIRKRAHEDQQLNGTEVTIVPSGPPAKRPNKDPMPSHCPSPEQFAAMMAASGQPLSRHHLNGKQKIAQMARGGNGRKQVISWMDAPDDVYFRANDTHKKARKILSAVDLRRAARKPWRTLPIKPLATEPSSRPIESQIVILD
ncbi:metastasis-associated protein MTA3 isoform X3 [Drosophila guanche]|uniref:Metastasis-associated protein MTA3 n=2 Tax=Drosophila guanche TaxID=7266 RepID=A0A3B0K5F8_DROGU|nr:metastasis-associated protein MTA3 isoform X3 [Drosophila guanche]SPP87922.1 blast:Metastasis-associated protein MTA3 [Drosophila guanche]